jgi:adenosylcobinamide kinase / adenosylcobinamide-phosphate guanylyltransferase
MRITLVTGGARSGKSGYAQQLAARAGDDGVTVIATARALDDDMRQRIARHRADRPAEWEVLEAPTAAGSAITHARHRTVLLDCLTVLSANAMMKSHAATRDAAEDAIVREVRGVIEVARERNGTLIVVTNEVGSSVHPPTEIGRWYQDGLGKANAFVASMADDVVLMVCGIALQLKGSIR